MQIEYDEAKRQANLTKHGVDFLLVVQVLLDPERLDWIDERNDYREERRVCVGDVQGRVYVLVYTRRHDVVRVISARKANEREQTKYRSI